MKKNILFFFCDQLLWNASGYAGHPIVKTPNLDKLASRSVNLHQTYSVSPVCVPARISLFTGQYAHTHGQPANDFPIRPGTKMFLETFQQAGYHTAAVGKLHFIPLENKKRFDWVQLHDSVGVSSDYTAWLESVNPQLADWKKHADPLEGEDGYIYGTDIYNDNKKKLSFCFGTSQIDAEHFYTQWISDTALKYLGEQRKDPFFLFVSFCGPHSPFFLPEPYRSMYTPADIEIPPNWKEQHEGNPSTCYWHHSLYGTRNMTEQQLREITALYYGHITLIDEHIGRVLEHLEKLGIADDTIIAFSADHGELLGAHGLFYKGVMYEESLRIPLLISGAGQKQGRVSEAMVSQVDIMPTLLDMAGIEIPEWSEGQSMKSLLEGDESAGRDEIFAEINKAATDEYLVGCRTHDYLFSCYLKTKDHTDEGELYDLNKDPGQACNLYHSPESVDLVNKFKNRIMLWLAGCKK